MPRSKKARLLAATAGKPRAFTLIEMMVGVGAVAIVAVGLAAIFRSVGDTVSGGRRVSVLNTYAALIESQLRRDFENMSRDGFLIIRNQWTDLDGSGSMEVPTDNLAIAPNTPRTPARRIDELQFVISGDFRSARKPLLPGVEPNSNTAIVYIGHGQIAPLPAVPALGTTPDRLNFKKPVPATDDAIAVLTAPFGAASGTVGQDNPNQFPINWTLLRHQTLLVSPESEKALPVDETTSAFGYDATNPAGYESLRNRATQFFLQPAASSPFRAISTNWPDTDAPHYPELRMRFDTSLYTTEGFLPQRASGVVDIATGTIAEIRSRVSGMDVFPRTITGPAIPDPALSITPRNPASGPQRPTSPQPIDFAHAWLNDLMPTDSRNFESARARRDSLPLPTAPPMGTRIRYEQGPTDLLAALSNPGSAYATAVRHADQLMLSSSNFVPHCVGFRVDWSFGLNTINGEVVWHGLPSRESVVAGTAADILPYPFSPVGRHDLDLVISRPPTGAPITHRVTDRLIHGVTPAVTVSEMTSYFGWIDPTYVPSGTAAPVADSPTSQVVPWAWPRMVRVTVTLADPLDPSDERSFQYIFAVPEAQGPRAQ
jgi:prepilin-type N-terminal cleavage/methylation domain-containing protein